MAAPIAAAAAGAALPSWLLPAASSLISGVANIFSGGSAAAEEKRRREAAQAILERSIIDDNELSSMLRNQNRMFNAQLQNTINSTAIRSGGIANKGVVGAAAAGSVNAANAQAQVATQQKVSDRNAQIRARQAGFEYTLGQKHTDPVGDFFAGATSGGIAGAQFGRTLGLLSKLEEGSNASFLGGGEGEREDPMSVQLTQPGDYSEETQSLLRNPLWNQIPY